ncbi:MAG: hypothetical protein ACYDAG_13560, partial [Chloroflexota bacterium]
MPDLGLDDLTRSWGPQSHEQYKAQIDDVLKRHAKDFYLPACSNELSRGTILPDLLFSFSIFQNGTLQFEDEASPGLVVSHPCNLEEGQGEGNDSV